MKTDVHNGQHKATQNKAFVVKVRYITSSKQFVDSQAQREETLAALKPRVLEFFELVEGNPNDGTKTYHFALDGQILNDLEATLGSIANNKHQLKLDLIERFEQG